VNDARILYIAPSPPYPLTNGQALRLVEERYPWNSVEDRLKTASRDLFGKRRTA
jgi:hypothetical protein